MSGAADEWRPYEERNNPRGVTDGRFLSASFVRIAAGPPRLAQLGGPLALATAAATSGITSAASAATTMVHPIGGCQNITLSQNRNFLRFWELGSEHSFSIAGRTVGQLMFSKILYHGPTLLKHAYAYYNDEVGPVTVPALYHSPAMATMANPHNVKIPPGYANFVVNLASDLFSQPVGFMIMMRDSRDDLMYGACYLEELYIPNYTITTDAQGTPVQETASAQFSWMVPVNIPGIALITDSTPLGASAGIQ